MIHRIALIVGVTNALVLSCFVCSQSVGNRAAGVTLLGNYRNGDGDGNVDVVVYKDFSAEISIGGELWLVASDVSIVVNHSRHSSRAGTLVPSGAPTQTNGTDVVGRFEAMSQEWSLGVHTSVARVNGGASDGDGPTPPVLRTTYRVYDDGVTVGFDQEFLTTVEGFSVTGDTGVATTEAWGSPGSGFPSFSLQNNDPAHNESMLARGNLGYTSYGEIGRVRVGVFPAGYKSCLLYTSPSPRDRG